VLQDRGFSRQPAKRAEDLSPRRKML